MKLLQVSSALESTFGGPPKVVINAHECLRERGIEAKLLVVGQNNHSFRSHPDTKNLLNPSVLLFPSRKSGLHGKFLNIFELRKFYTLVKSTDCVLTHQLYNFQNIYLLILTRMLSKPYILMPHGTLTKYQKKQHRIRKLVVDNLFFNRVATNSYAIAVATNTERNQLDTHLLSKSRNIGIGIKQNENLNFVGSRTPGFTFVFLGRLAEVKRVDLTILAFSEFSKQYPDCNLKIAGDGDYKIVEKLRFLVSQLGINDKVQFLGWLGNSEKIGLFTDSNYIILNSEKENFAIGIAEGQSCGLPALITREVAFSEIVEKFNSGVIIEALTVEAIVKGMLELVRLDYQEISRNALKAASFTSWDSVIPLWIRLFENVISEHGASKKEFKSQNAGK